MKYQQKAFTFAKYGDITYPFLSIGEEAGEVLGKIAKAVRKSNGSTPTELLEALRLPMTPEEVELRNALIKELGDVQWQLAACCTELGITLEDVQNANIAKLEGREVRGTIIGEGDER